MTTLSPMPLAKEEIQSLVLFMKAQKVASFRFEGLEVTFSPAAFLNLVPEAITALSPEEQVERARKEEESILFHSAG